MKKLLYLFMIWLVSSSLSGQSYENHVELGQAWGGGSSVDINGDGMLDFYISGMKNNPQEPLLDLLGVPMDLNDDGIADTTERWQRLYMHTDMGMVNTPTNLRVVDRANLDWADIDGDGLVDLIAAQHNFDPNLYGGGVYKNLGDGNFTKLDWPLNGKTNAVAFADFNNDGLIDYIGLSADSLGSKIYMNKGNNTFEETNVDLFGEYKLGLAYVEVIDFNNDGLADVFVTANCDNPATNKNARVIADIFINNDEEPGTFYRAFIGDNGVNQKGNGGVDFADFNNDGYVDFALHGEGGAGTPEPGSGMNEWMCISHVYINQKDGTFKDKAQPNFRADLRPLNSTGDATKAIDWNYDGNYDLFISGWEPSVNTQTGYYFEGDGAGNFKEGVRIPGGSETVLLFNDWNNDGFIDMLASGHCWDDMWYKTEEVKGRTASVLFNSNTSKANQKPSAPANLGAKVKSSMVTLSWDAATDDKTAANALTYEYYIKDGSDKFFVAPSSILGGTKDGVRMVQKRGNIFQNKSVTLFNLKDGDYTWGVQAIDASYEGSAFSAVATFTIGDGGTISVKRNLADDLKIYISAGVLSVNSLSNKTGYVEIYTINGKRIASGKLNGEYTSVLSNGVYIVRVAVGNEIETRKVVSIK